MHIRVTKISDVGTVYESEQQRILRKQFNKVSISGTTCSYVPTIAVNGFPSRVLEGRIVGTRCGLKECCMTCETGQENEKLVGYNSRERFYPQPDKIVENENTKDLLEPL